MAVSSGYVARAKEEQLLMGIPAQEQGLKGASCYIYIYIYVYVFAIKK
jgi:hypothetical protein